MGRSPAVFVQPLRYAPERWLRKDDHSFKALAFGFGARQCIGRRFAEAEMMLFLMHVSVAGAGRAASPLASPSWAPPCAAPSAWG